MFFLNGFSGQRDKTCGSVGNPVVMSRSFAGMCTYASRTKGFSLIPAETSKNVS